DITPYRISSEALAVINHFLDEFLFLLVESSCSLSLENIKLSILNVLPTHLGKNSIKEADFELKTFLESGNFDKNLEKTVELLNPYPIQRIFEQFRIKCKYYSTLSEQNFSINDRDPKTMPGLHESDGIYISPSLAIYMTAILEYVGEHILILVANALKQQGDVTIAKANEVYLALTDSQVLPAFQRTSLREKMEETLSILLKSQDCNITLSPTSPMTPLSANITDGNITFRSLGIIAPSSPISDDDFTSRFSEGGISPSSTTNVDNNTTFRSPPNSPTKVDNTTFRSPPNSPTKVDNTTFRSPPNSPTKVTFRSPPSSPTKVDNTTFRSPPNSPTKVAFRSPPSSPTKVGDIISRSPEATSPSSPIKGAIPPSPIKQNFHNEIGGGPRKGSVDSALWNRSSASQNQIFGRTSLESKNNIGIHYSKHKLKERDIKSISSLDEIDKAKSFEHLISNNQNLTLKVSLTSNRMKTIETQKQEEPRKYEPREPKKPKESLFEFLKNTDPEEIFNKPTGKLKRKDSKLDLLQKRLFANKSSSIGRSTTGPSYPHGRPRHIPLIPSGRLSTSEIRSSSNNTNTLHHSKSLDHLSTIYNRRSKENNNIYDNLYNRQKPRSESLKFNEDDYSIINYERPSNRFDTQDLIDFLNTSTPPNDTTFTEKKEKIFTKLLSKLRISSKGKYNNGSQRSNNNKSVNKPKYIKIQIPEILRKEETQEQKDNNHHVQENYVIKSVKLNPLPVRKSSLKSLKVTIVDDDKGTIVDDDKV
ncbi:842_t:CDS:2, partial [Gigaspora margarita]